MSYKISSFKVTVNFLLFPYRALFKQQGFGSFVMSMEEERLIRVARYCIGKVLDVGCGPHNKFIKNIYLNGIGIDFYPYDGVPLLLDDATHLPFDDNSFDTVTLNAVGGHIPKHLRSREFKEFTRILIKGGRLIMTEGEPITQYLHHKWVYFLDKFFGTNIDVNTERGMAEDEEYCMPRNEILQHFVESGLTHMTTERFWWHLHSVFVAEKL